MECLFDFLKIIDITWRDWDNIFDFRYLLIYTLSTIKIDFSNYIYNLMKNLI